MSGPARLPMTKTMIAPASTSAVLGMRDAANRFDAAADRIAGAATASDLPGDLVAGTVLAPAAYSANATVARVADETRGTLLDVLA